jgi:ribonuclease HI
VKSNSIIIYTDGSCNPEYGAGAWAALLFVDDEKIVLFGNEEPTTHQRMELTAVIKAFEYLAKANLIEQPVQVFTDSQYVVGIPGRSGKLKTTSFVTKGGLPLRNADLLQLLMEHIEKLKPTFIKVKAHFHDSSSTGNHEVDKLSRKLVREAVEQKLKLI